jgi:hypothetical protein
LEILSGCIPILTSNYSAMNSNKKEQRQRQTGTAEIKIVMDVV